MPELLGISVETVAEIEGGWDYAVFEVNGAWIVRIPRRPEVHPWLRKEVRLLRELAPRLPLPVPVFELVVDDDEPFVAYRKLRGRRLDEALRADADASSLGRMLGSFLAELHATDTRDAEAWTGADADDWEREQRRFREECERAAFRLLHRDERDRIRSAFDEVNDAPKTTLVHGDLGPDHVLVDSRRITAVIDWSDARVGDPAIDLAWPLHATDAVFAETLAESYSRDGLDDETRERARRYYEVAHLHEVVYGLERGDDDLVDRALVDLRNILLTDGGAARLG